MNLLDTAFTPEPPGAPLPPGPRANAWPGEPADDAPVSALIHRLWRPRGYHLRPDGTPTSVPRRAVPSAGGAYPVQWHVAVPDGAAEPLPPGRYFYDPDRGRLLRRYDYNPTGGRMARDAEGLGGDGVLLGITVQPGRTFGRYRHRAWPLWIADAAYALEAVRAAVPAALLPPGWSDLAAVRRALGLAPAAETGWWLDRGLVPELAMAMLRLPPGWRCDETMAAALETRRSPALDRFTARRAGHDPMARGAGRGSPARGAGLDRAVPEVAEVARQSGQAWVLGADRVLTWPRTRKVDAAVYAHLWLAHREAARRSYDLIRQGHGVRAVSGFTAPPGDGGRPLLHAITVLDHHGHGERERHAQPPRPHADRQSAA